MASEAYGGAADGSGRPDGPYASRPHDSRPQHSRPQHSGPDDDGPDDGGLHYTGPDGGPRVHLRAANPSQGNIGYAAGASGDPVYGLPAHGFPACGSPAHGSGARGSAAYGLPAVSSLAAASPAAAPLVCQPPVYGPLAYRPLAYSPPGYAVPARGGDPSDSEPTQPLPIRVRQQYEQASDVATAKAAYKAAKAAQRRPGRRFLYRLTLTVVTMIACAAIGFVILLLITPSAGEAAALARELARAHGIPYPGPPVPANFSGALTATEDHRFYQEPGVDPLAVARLAAGAATGRSDQGGATIEQQLAKMLFFPGYTSQDAPVLVKAKEVALAVKLNAMYGKDEILRLYAEVAYYGHGFYGLEAASCGYFGRPPADLTVAQSAMLAGAVNAPSQDDPILHPVQAHARLGHVLARMAAVGLLTQEQAARALRAPLGLDPSAILNC